MRGCAGGLSRRTNRHARKRRQGGKTHIMPKKKNKKTQVFSNLEGKQNASGRKKRGNLSTEDEPMSADRTKVRSGRTSWTRH